MGINPEDIALYLNIAFISTVGMGVLFGLLKGFRRSLYSFIITIIFIGVFFLTVNQVVGVLYTLNLGFLGGVLGQVDAALSSATSVQDAVHIYLPTMIGDMLDTSFSNPDFWAFIDAIGMFVLKIVYTIIYFTVIQFLYRFILFIISLFVFRKGRAKNKKGKRNRPLGAVFGALTAAVNVFVMIIVLSGVMSIGESLANIQADQLSNQIHLEPSMRPDMTELSQSTNRVGRLRYQPLAEEQPNLDELLTTLRDVVEVYNENFVIQAVGSFKLEADEQTGEEKSMPIYLFDEVLSINYDEQSIGLREDLRTFSQLANIYLTSDYFDTNDLTDISSSDIETVFTTLSHSKLLTSLIPVGIEVGIDYANIDYEIDKELIYDTIEWDQEIQQLGAVATTGFMILENANALEEGTDFNTVTVSGSQVQTMFNQLSDSEIAKYGAFIAVNEVLATQESLIRSIITVPDNLDWSAEFTAFGAIANEILQNDLTINDLQTDDQGELLRLFAGIDLTVLLESELTTRAMINILSGNSELELDIDFLVIPSLTDEEWYDQLSGGGELLNVLTSISILINSVSEIDLNDPQISDLAGLSASDIDSMFESEILRASITELLLTLDTGDFDLIVPDSVLNEDGYLIKAEAVAMLSAITMLANEVPCDDGDTTCAEIGFDFAKVTDLDSENISTLFDSDVLFSTTSYLLLTFDELVVPDDIKVDIIVDGSALSIVSRDEVINAFSAITALGIADFQNIQMDESLLLNLSVDPELQPTVLDTDKTDKIFDSKILHATISYFLIDMATVTPPDTSPIIIPFLAAKNYEGTTSNEVRIDDGPGGVTYISENELVSILSAVLILDIQDFTSIDTISFDTISENIDALLDSAILHATVSEQILQMKDNDALVIPYQDVDGVDVVFTVGDVEAEETTYVSEAELIAVLDALALLDISSTEDINTLSLETIDIQNIIDNDDLILSSAIIHATISSQIIELSGSGELVIPRRSSNQTEDLIRLSVGPVGEEIEFIAKQEIKSTLNALTVLEITNFDSIAIDTTILTKLSVDPVSDPTTLDTVKSDALLASKIIHATISKVIFDAAIPDEVTLEQALVVPYLATENYSNGDNHVRFLTQDDDEYIIEEELTEIFKVVLLLDIADFTEVNTLDLSIITSNRNNLFDSAIIHATISDKLIAYTDDGSLIVPTYDLDNQPIIITLGDAAENEETTYIAKAELIATLDALDVFEITNFDSVSVDASILTKLAVDPDATDLILDESKSARILSSKIIQATISKVIFDAAEPDEITGESDIIVPYQAESNYNNDTYEYYQDDVRFYTTDDTDEYIVEAELVELFRVVLALNMDDFANVDGISLDTILPHKNTIFNSAIIQATISDIILGFTDDGSMVVPTYDLDNELITVSTGDALEDEETTYITADELINTLTALSVLEITDFTSVNVDVSILNKLAVDPEAAILVLDETKSQQVLSSKIIHATITKVVLDAAAPDEITGESDIIVPYIAETNYNNMTYAYTDDDVRFFTTGDADEYIVEAELTELFRFVLDLNLTDFTNIDGLLLSDILPFKDTMFDSAIIQATISDIILGLDDDGTLVVPFYDLSNANVRVTTGDALESEDVEFVAETELIDVLVALDTLDIQDFTNVNVDISILNNLAIDPDATILVLDELKSQAVLDSKIIHATITKVILDAGEPDEITGDSDIVVPYIAETNYNNTTYGYTDDDVRFFTTSDADEYIVEAELTELFRFVLDLNLTDFTNISGLLLSDILPFKDTMFDSAIIQATISDIILDFDDDGTLVVPFYDLTNASVRVTRGDALEGEDVEFIIEAELVDVLVALDTLDIQDFTNVSVDVAILNELAIDPDATDKVLDEIKSQNVLASKIIHATLTKVIMDAAEPDVITGDQDLIVPYYAETNYDNDTYNYYVDEVRFYTTGDTDEYIVQAELTELFRFVLALDLTDFTNIAGLSLTDILPHKDTIFDSAIIQAKISDMILDFNDDGSLVVPTYDLTNTEITITKGLLTEETIYVSESELISTLVAMDVLGITDLTSVNVDISILSNLAVDPEATEKTLDATKSENVLSSKIIHATISKVILDVDGTSLIVPFVAENNYSTTTYDSADYAYDGNDVKFLTTGDADSYIVQAELTEIFRIVLLLDITDFALFDDSDGSLFGELLPHKDVLFDSAIIQATVSNQILDLEVSGNLVVPTRDLSETLVVIDLAENLTISLISTTELINTLSALEVLGITSFNSVNIDAGILQELESDTTPDTVDQTKFDTLMSSKIVHATISGMIIDAGEGATPSLIVPYQSPDNFSGSGSNNLRLSNTTSDEYIIDEELQELFRIVIILEVDDFSLFDDSGGTLFASIFPHKDTIFDSVIIQATISDQIFDIEDSGSLVVPSLDDTNLIEIEVTVGDALLNQDTTFIIKDELVNMLTALDTLGISSFNGININASILQNLGDGGTPQHVDTEKSAAVLSSKIVHASITDMLLDAGQDGTDTLVVPYLAAEDYTSTSDNEVRFVTNDSDIYVIDAEMNKLFDALLVLNITDFNTVSTLGLSDIINNKETLMASAILHATISKQVIDLDTGVGSSVIVPEYDELGASIIFEDTTDIAYTITYLVKTELFAFFDSINLIGDASSIGDFDGSVDLTLFFESSNPGTYQTNQSTLLASAVLQATISDKISDLDGSQMIVPSYSVSESAVEVTHGSDYFIYESEIKALIDVMDLVGASNIESFSGTFTVGAFDETSEQDTLLASAIMHRTLSNQLLNNAGIVVPLLSLESDNTTTNDVHITTTLGSEDYIVGQEIRDLIAVIAILNSGDDSASLNSINSTFSLSTFSSSNPSNQAALLASAIMHASFSKELIDLSDDVLFIPTYSQDGEVFANKVKFLDVDTDGTDYISQAEVKDIIDAFVELGVGDLGDASVVSAGSFFSNIELYLNSASFHATISNKLFSGSGSLIIPTRDINDTYDVKIIQTDVTYLEHDETVALVAALNELGLTEFSSTIDGSTITGLTGGELDIILISGTMHLTFEDIIQSNTALDIPALALDDLFAQTDILVKQEVKDFILGASAFINSTGSGSSISNVTFTWNDIASLDYATRDVMLNSMIVRNMITPDVETAAAFSGHTFTNSDYENNDPGTFLLKAAIQDYLGE